MDPFIHDPNFTFIQHDVVNPLDLPKIDQLYHLACPASPDHYQANPIRTAKISFLGTLNMCGIAKRHKARLLLTSTSEVYGDPLVHPQPETYHGNVSITGPRSCYDEGKRIAESLCMDYHRQHDLDIRIARLFNTYGPNMQKNDGRVISNFINQALDNSPITIYGTGRYTRSFCYIDDMVNGLIDFMNQDTYIGPLNIGNDDEITIQSVADLILSLVPTSTSVITYEPSVEDDPKCRKPDLTLAKSLIHWQPKISLNTGLIQTLNYFRGIV